MAVKPARRWRYQWRFWIRVGLGILLYFLLGGQWGAVNLPLVSEQPVAIAQTTPGVVASLDAAQLMQQGRQRYQSGQVAEALQLWQQAAAMYQAQTDPVNQALALSYLALAQQQLGQFPAAKATIAQSLELIQPLAPQTKRPILAQVLNTQGSLQFAQGQAEAALATWEQAEQNYQQAGDEIGRIGSLVNQTQAQRSLGFYLQAKKTLMEVERSLQQQTDSDVKVLGLQNLGDVLRSVGDVESSQRVLQQSLSIAQQIQLPDDSDIRLSLGNTARAKKDWVTALTFYQQVAARSTSPLLQAQAQLNRLSLFIDHQQWPEAQQLQAQLLPQVTRLPLSRSAIYAQINLIQSLSRLHAAQSAPAWNEIATMAATAVQNARTLGDAQAESYALGTLGGLYEKTQQWAEAQDLTQKALVLAQTINAPHITYQWQWQLGRLLKAQSSSLPSAAISAYTDAVNTLKALRNDLVAISTDVQFSFREQVEPVYRELVELLLEPSQGEVTQDSLKQAREVIESLQLAQLDNFFQEACLNARRAQIDRVDTSAAVVYSIVLPEHLEVILSLPNQPLRHYATAIAQPQMEALLDKTRRLLRLTAPTAERLKISEQVYNLILRPLEADLAASGIKTLVFVLDGALQNVPMAALYDGKQYVIEKYSIALAPGLQLFDPQRLEREQVRVLVGGLTEASQGFSALPGVASEVQQVTSEVPAQVLLNQQFTSTTLQDQIAAAPYPIVHLATHGQFSSNAKETFILAWDNPINVKQLDSLLRARGQRDRRPIELLVLSACQTAAGDRRATLGLAGVAVRSGARSTLATLWSVDDQSTAYLMAQFYQKLAQPSLTKAEALRQAQLALQKQPGFDHPYYWAPFVLVGNWL
ncbi:CHAT domain-containing protein [Pantanalinema sp. GBBB05]|uniref:CHAT domain-containing protein n=1 Tax=Pantanalinema sp. GBBB05 TaxID=2604139 RepID=UPI001D51B0D8|nr:CHAT domain-containing protein [Pantanalinema sp. GBBB05]